jgi:hypothetical protein
MVEKSGAPTFAKGGGLFHLCFEVGELDRTLQRLRDTGDAIVVQEPVPAPPSTTVT